MPSMIETVGLINPQNAHFRDPGMSSKVGATTGCGGSTTSKEALQGTGIYRAMATPQKGGYGYGANKVQDNASLVGNNSHYMEVSPYKKYDSVSDTGLGASKQHGGYYGFDDKTGEPLSTFAGSGYPPITTGNKNSCAAMNGGKKHKRRMLTKKSKRMYNRSSKRSSKKMTRKSNKRVKKSKSPVKKPRTVKRVRFHKKRSTRMKKSRKQKKQRGGYSQYMNNVAYSHIYETGAPPSLSSSDSALANPVPFTPKNNCSDNYKHSGSE